MRRTLALAVWLLPTTMHGAPAFDLEALPHYAWAPDPRNPPGQHCHNDRCSGEWGVIRIHASELQQGLIHRWQDHFLRLHPNIRYSLYTVPNGFAGITTGTAEIAVVGHSAWRSDLKAFEGVHGHPPLGIEFATGGFVGPPGNTPAPVFFVNRDNPIAGLTLAQLDGIFGAARSGGWRGTEWTEAAARGREADIRSWGGAGLRGDWAGLPIHLFGFDATLSNWSDLIQRRVFHGGDKWNPALHEMVRGGTRTPADWQIVQAVAQDRAAIGFDLMRVAQREPRIRVLPIALDAQHPYVMPSERSVYERSYPLFNSVYLYVDRPPGGSLPPRIREFIRYVLSQEGQRDVLEDGLYLPLTAAQAATEREKIE